MRKIDYITAIIIIFLIVWYAFTQTELKNILR